MSIQKFNLREWLVPPILVPAFLGLLIAGGSIFGGRRRVPIASICSSPGSAASVMITGENRGDMRRIK
jgi:hypothetical protein